ncbi:CG15930 [Drosophila busckii]|uniref:CG15930 n=2 Tax=Drosophila busckii TaxID=30019 RepID=A0A0M3QYX1_DROBS|nr:CG15930 [Drosophila busckii]
MRFDDMLPIKNKEYNHVDAWLSTPEVLNLTAHLEPHQGSATQHNPFVETPNYEPNDEPQQQLSIERLTDDFLNVSDCNAAVPKYALSDMVFMIDKPKDAVPLGTEFPIKKLPETCGVDKIVKLFIVKVYSPFQFWFHDADEMPLLNNLTNDMMNFFYSIKKTRWQLTKFFLKPGYICAASYESSWRRARILRELVDDGHSAALVYFVDFGSCEQLSLKDLYFLDKSHAVLGPIALRGTITDVYPLGFHWPAKATRAFKDLVLQREMHGIVREIDKQERIVFLNLMYNSQLMEPNISKLLINDRMAGPSYNYDPKVRVKNYGRRVRYLRELLPTFDMLEAQLFPTPTSEAFEKEFDAIIFSSRFYYDYLPPKLANPFLYELQNALTAWLDKYKKNNQSWRRQMRAKKAEQAKKQRRST